MPMPNIVPASVSAGVKAAGDLYNIAQQAKDNSVASLTEWIKDSNILMRMYIDQNLANDEIMVPLVGYINQLVTAFILTAIGMQEAIQSGKTVRQLMKSVGTESFVDIVKVVDNGFGLDTPVGAMEASVVYPNVGAYSDVSSGMEAKIEEVDAGTRLYSGRVVELRMFDKNGNNGDTDKDGKSKGPCIYMYVQLIPYLLPAEVIGGFIKMNFTPDWRRRLQAWKAGEISFWDGFIRETDRVAERGKILKADKDGILREIEDHKIKQFGKKITSTIGLSPARHNAANVIIVAEKSSFEAAAVEAGIDLKNFNTRQTFFKSTMSTMLVVVDTNYAMVDLYLCGLDSRGTYTFSMIKSTGKFKEQDNLKELMMLMGQQGKF